MARTAAFHSLGCRVNSYETDAMRRDLKARGYRETAFSEKADIYIVNTCTVTAVADKKSRQMLHRAREMNPDALIVACGCYVEDAAEKLRADAAADLLLTNEEKKRLGEILDEYFRAKDADGDADAGLYSGQDGGRTDEADHAQDHVRSFIKIQDGCNQFCTYCMIPYVRGRVRSRSAEEILAEIAEAAGNGKREIVLTGIHISSYGMDLDHPGENRQTPDASRAETNERLLHLLQKTAGIPGIERIRFGSLEPGIITERFAREISQIPQVCPSFHLSMQSGCDATLARMHRKYRSSDYAEKCDLLRKYFRDPAVMTDVIAGFPGETEEEFLATCRFIEEIRFSRMHIFKYSRRKGTKAADMPDQVPGSVKKERADILASIAGRLRSEYAGSFLGRPSEVLFEDRDADGKWTGYTREYVPVIMEDGEDLTNRILRVIPGEEKDGTLLCRRPG